jgi:hypothetical protein
MVGSNVSDHCHVFVIDIMSCFDLFCSILNYLLIDISDIMAFFNFIFHLTLE